SGNVAPFRECGDRFDRGGAPPTKQSGPPPTIKRRPGRAGPPRFEPHRLGGTGGGGGGTKGRAGTTPPGAAGSNRIPAAPPWTLMTPGRAMAGADGAAPRTHGPGSGRLPASHSHV